MASTQEDLARLLVSIELSQAKTEKQAAAIAKAAERAAKNIDGSFAAANNNVAKSFERSAKSATVSIGQQKAAVTNLTFQLNDIAQGLLTGQSPFRIMAQQGSQVTQALEQAGGGIGAIRALGGAFTQMLNPVSLATFAIIGLGGAAIQYFAQMLSDSADSEKTLKEQAELIGKVADKWGDALPALKAYNDEKKRIQDASDLEGATGAAVHSENTKLREFIQGASVDLADLLAKLQATGQSDTDVVKLQAAFAAMASDVKSDASAIAHLRETQAALTDLYNQSHIPAAKEMADAFGKIADEAERAAAAGQKLRADANLQDFFKVQPLGGLTPLTSGGGQFLNPAEQQDYDARNTKSQFELELDKAGGAIDSFVDHVIKAESGGNSSAKNPNSSATGAGQFIASTWLDLFKKYFPDRAEGMTRGAILALRTDANVSRSLIEAYAKENAAVLQSAGVTVNEAALQLAHFLGAGDAVKVLKAASGTPLAGLISAKSIAANPTILGGGATVNDAISYAENRASGSGRAGSRNKSPADIFQGSLADVQKRIDLINAEYDAQSKLNPAINDYGYALEKAKIKQQLLSDAQKAGLEITPELSAKIDALAGNYAKASAESEHLKASQAHLADVMQQSNAFGKDVLGGFIQDLREGKSASEALSDALGKVADKLIDIGLNALFPSSGGGGLGGIFGAIGSIFSFDDGGYTGDGGKKQPAGVVHKGEVVFSQDDVARLGGVSSVEALRTGKGGMRAPGVARGGGGDMRITVGVGADQNGNLLPFVQSVTRDGIRQAAPSIVQASVQQGQKATRKSMPSLLAEAQSRSL